MSINFTMNSFGPTTAKHEDHLSNSSHQPSNTYLRTKFWLCRLAIWLSTAQDRCQTNTSSSQISNYHLDRSRSQNRLALMKTHPLSNQDFNSPLRLITWKNMYPLHADSQSIFQTLPALLLQDCIARHHVHVSKARSLSAWPTKHED